MHIQMMVRRDAHVHNILRIGHVIFFIKKYESS